ncbi:IS200/IS605 family transposase [Cupriavidus basilensis]|uniref:IS200/IS605 family transposase n=1 Tax=Cupriavidus basilensis TaxID=68895 RepID=UPI0020A6470B|nr:IS200/IS605 family transposase [Cupriavidus basilensis]MCP3024015.1 IS200/IS605 family transposase [Cupriavidus basilensis]
MKETSLQALYHCVYALQYHLVLVTKYRRKCLTSAMLAAFERLAAERCMRWGGKLIESNGEADHVHMLIELPPTVALAEFVGALKTGTSRRLRRAFKDELAAVYRTPVLWSRSYCVLSCGGAPLEVAKQYIQQQSRPLD